MRIGCLFRFLNMSNVVWNIRFWVVGIIFVLFCRGFLVFVFFNFFGICCYYVYYFNLESFLFIYYCFDFCLVNKVVIFIIFVKRINGNLNRFLKYTN